MKATIQRILTFIVLVSSSLHSYAYEFTDNGLVFKWIVGDYVRLSGIKQLPENGELIVPDKAYDYGELQFVDGISDMRNSKNLDLVKSIVINENVNYIDPYALVNCKNLTTLEYNVEHCGYFATINMSDDYSPFPNTISNLIIGSNVEYIPKAFVSRNTSLENVIIPDNVVSIGPYAFKNCNNLYQVEIGANVTSIGKDCFSGCKEIHTIISNSYDPPSLYGEGVFDNETYENCLTYVPSNALESYNAAAGWSKFNHILPIGGIMIDSIALNAQCLNLSEGESFQFIVNFSPENATIQALEWKSSNGEIATISQDGTLTAISKGEAIITAATTDGSNVSASCTVNVVKLVSGIVLSETELTLNEGQSAQITATVTPELANNKSLIWSSSNEAVATVNQDGKITAITKGSAIISAESTDGSNISASCNVNVVKLVSGIVLSETEMSLNEGSTAQLTAIVSSDANNPTLVWVSSDENIATVSQDGKITAVSKGTAIITAKTTDGSNISASCTVDVIKLVNSIILSETEMTLNEGETATITATVMPELANNKSISWSSSNPAIASVDEYGVIAAQLQGTTIISAKSTDGSDVSASCNVTVIKLVTGINISESEITLKIGEQATITAYALPSDATNPILHWYSEDEDMASVNDGVVTAIKEGTTYIVVETTDNSNISEKCKINIVPSSGIYNTYSETAEIFVSQGEICMVNTSNEESVYIFKTDGTLIYETISTGQPIFYKPSFCGVYVVIIGGNSYKVVIR